MFNYKALFIILLTLFSFFTSCKEDKPELETPNVYANFDILKPAISSGYPSQYTSAAMQMDDTTLTSPWGIVLGQFSYASTSGSTDKGCVLFSSDRGKNWGVSLTLDDELSHATVMPGGKVVMKGLNRLYLSSNYGISFKEVYQGYNILNYDLENDQIITMGSSFTGGQIAFRSNDGGSSFKQLSVPAPTFTFQKTSITNAWQFSEAEYRLYGVGEYTILGLGNVARGYIFSTADTGRTWTYTDSTLIFSANSEFVTIDNIKYAVALDFISDLYVICKSINGIDWQIISYAERGQSYRRVIPYKDRFLYVLLEEEIVKMDLNGNKIRTFKRPNTNIIFTDLSLLGEDEGIVTTKIFTRANAPLYRLHK